MQARAPDLLIAPPSIQDSRFKDTVLMLTHKRVGVDLALCLNKHTDHSLMDIRSELGLEDPIMNHTLYWGGPVNPGTIWVLHSAEWRTAHTLDVDEEWAMTSDREALVRLAHGDTPKWFRIFFGFCSWAPGQLQGELDATGKSSWLIAHNPGPEWIMEQDADTLWAGATTLASHQAVDTWL